MELNNNVSEYKIISKIFHWLSAAVLLVQIPLGFYLVGLDFSEKRLIIENIHVIFGLSLFCLTVLRLIYKIFNPTLLLKNSIFPAQKLIAKLKSNVKEVNGSFISVWHNESLSNQQRWSGWREVFEHTFKN